jgi:hypothetical protein
MRHKSRNGTTYSGSGSEPQPEYGTGPHEFWLQRSLNGKTLKGILAQDFSTEASSYVEGPPKIGALTT